MKASDAKKHKLNTELKLLANNLANNTDENRDEEQALRKVHGLSYLHKPTL